MTHTTLQFHATPIEICQLAADVARDFDLHVIASTAFPYDTAHVSVDEILDYCKTLAFPDRFAFTTISPNTNVNGNIGFFEKNPNCLMISIGKLTDDGLKESAILAQSVDGDARAVWRSIISRFKKTSQTGAWAMNPNTLKSTFARNHRYTKGAADLYRSGVSLLAIGGNRYVLADPSQRS